MAECAALWSTIQSWVEVQHNPGCMQVGPGSLRLRPEGCAAAGQEAAEGTPAGQGCKQPGCKASVEEGRRDRWLPDMLEAVPV